MTAFLFLVIHIITTQIIVKLFAVVLLLLLNMGESVTKDGAGKLKNAGVVDR